MNTRTMKHHLVIVVLFLLLGAAVNVLVAWGCAAWLQPEARVVDVQGEMRWPRSVPPEWPRPTHAQVGMAPGNRQQIWIVRADGPLDASHSLSLHSWGWPIVSLQQEVQATASVVPGPLLTISRRSQSRYDWEPSGWISRRLGVPPDRPLPLRPDWPGVVAGSIAYGAITLTVVAAVRWLRSAYRTRRGLCPACAYPVGSTEVCAECGGPVRRQP